MGRNPNYSVIKDRPGEPLVIRDIGPWDKYLTITNGAEEVVKDLFNRGYLPDNRRLFYYDSDGDLDELVHSNGTFVSFAPVREGGKG